MKILHVIDKLDVGGAERVVVDLCNILFEHGVDVTVIQLLDEGPLTHEINSNVLRFSLKRYYKWSLRSMWQFIRISQKFDIVHVHLRHNLKYLSLCCFLFPFHHFKVVFHDHYGDIHVDKKCPLWMKFSMKCLLHTYIGVSSELVLWAKQVQACECLMLPNIIRKKSGYCGTIQKNSIVLVGNLRPTKNYQFVFDLALQMPQITFTIYGNSDTDSYSDYLMKHKPQNISIVEGVNNIQAILGKYVMALHVSKSETGPLVLIEYLAHQIPFLTFDTGEVVEQIKNDLPEFIVDSFNIDEWSLRVNAMLLSVNMEDLKKRMASVYAKYFSEETYYSACAEIYNNILHS